MYLDEIRQNFLIIGFTGPVRSGCTTSAEFLTKDLRKEITIRNSKINALSEIIIQQYKDIETSKKDVADDEMLRKKRSDLLAAIKDRQVYRTLYNYRKDAPRYISMTEMLFKASIEAFYKNNAIIGRADQKKECDIVIEEIKRMKFKGYINKIALDKECINNLLEKRKYDKFGPNNAKCIILYERYLKDILTLKNNVIARFNREYGVEGAYKYAVALQNMGDNIRRCGNPFNYSINKRNIHVQKHLSVLSVHANNVIKYYRNRYRFWEGRREQNEYRKPHVFVIECFRNHAEVEYLRCRYYEFFLFSLYANSNERLKREYEGSEIYGNIDIKQSDVKKRFEEIDKRDSGEKNKDGELFKQNVTGAVFRADIAICNEGSCDELKEKILRYYALVRQPGCIQPTSDEMFMHLAYSMSLRSRCISRKVGAVIVGERGYVVGAGWNDVGEGQIGCGDRMVNEILALGGTCIPLELEGKEKLRKSLYRRYQKDKMRTICFRDEYGRNSMNKGKSHAYCRALHAEENAILQTGKIGGVGVRNGIIYTTTFPCELCAKKIYQSGIRKIIYTEPYPEAISGDVFLRDGIKKVDINQFEGVMSHSYYRLYKNVFDEKDLISIRDGQASGKSGRKK